MFKSEKLRLRVLSDAHAVDALEFEHEFDLLETYYSGAIQLFSLEELKSYYKELNSTSIQRFFAIEAKCENENYKLIGRCG